MIRFRLSDLRALTKSWLFWLIQILTVLIALLHEAMEPPLAIFQVGNAFLVPASLLWAPIIYSAIKFGITGSMVTAILVIIIMTPNFIFWHSGADRFWEISQIASMMLVAILMARYIEQKKEAEDRARIYAEHAVRTREEERRSIGRYIHDNTIQVLATICRELDTVKYLGKNLPTETTEGIAKARKHAEEVADDLRSFIKEIRPTALDELGLVRSTRALAESYSQDGMNAEFEILGEERRLAQETETILFRIAQEALRNVKRHAKATEVTVNIRFSRDEVELSVTDNGAGFSAPISRSRFADSGKFGVLGMYEYAEMLSGRLKIESRPGHGASVIASIPLRKTGA